MGKASRAKRERREGSDEMRRLAEEAAKGQGRSFPVFWAVVGLIVVGGLVGLFAFGSSDEDTAATKAAKDAPVFADVTVTGDELPGFPGNDSDDPAVGDTIPTLAGTGIDGIKQTISDDEGAQVLVFVAHWCPHCQKEVPRIVEWSKSGKAPKGVKVRAISTGASENQPNFPPAAWLAKEDWPYDVLVDDEIGSAAQAMGLEGYPFMVFVAEDGTVVQRSSGEMEIADFDKAVQALVPKS